MAHIELTGLTSDEVLMRLDVFGYNKLEEKKENKLLKFLGFMWNPLSWIMQAASLMAITVAHGGGAITKRMTSIEEMAGMDVLCSDKTGTLTHNKLTVDKNMIEVFEFFEDISVSLTDLASRELAMLKELKKKEEEESNFGVEDLPYYVKRVQE